MTQRCRSCKAEIRWVRMNGTGKAMPLDAAPSADGTIRIRPDGQAEVRADLEAAAGARLYTSHFATCPYADQHRRPR